MGWRILRRGMGVAGKRIGGLAVHFAAED